MMSHVPLILARSVNVPNRVLTPRHVFHKAPSWIIDSLAPTRCSTSSAVASGHDFVAENVINQYRRAKRIAYCLPVPGRVFSTLPEANNPEVPTATSAGVTKAGQADGGGPAGSDGPPPMSNVQKYGYIFFAVSMLGLAVAGVVIFSLPDVDENGQYVQDEYSSLPAYSQYYQRLKGNIFKTKKDLEEPFSDKLLPDPLPEPYIQPKYTVLVELTGLLVHSNWTHKHGWRFQKRPGLDVFLSQIGYPQFELVVYTVENAMTLYPIIDALDSNNKVMYRLFRDATRYVNGNHTKDLSAINRDLKKVILIDWNENAVALNRDNALVLPKWEGNNSDRVLIGLTQFIQAIKQTDVEDVRDVLTYYRKFKDPIAAFHENQRKLQMEMEAEEKLKEEQKQKKSFLSGLSGLGKQRT